MPSLSLADRLLMSCLHQPRIKLSLIYDAGDDDDEDVNEVEDDVEDDHHHHHR